MVAAWTAEGTHTGEIELSWGPSIPPTGRKIRRSALGHFIIDEGKIKGMSVYWEEVGLLEILAVNRLREPAESSE